MKPTLKRDIFATLILAFLSAGTSYLSVNIPNTEIYFDFRWIFGSLSFAIIYRWYFPLFVAFALSISGFHQVPLHVALLGNLLWAIPFGLSLRFISKKLIEHQTNPILVAVIWLVAILLGYQIFQIPLIWTVLGIIENSLSFKYILEGYKLQPFLEESVIVAIVSAMGMMVYSMYISMKEREHYFSTVLHCIGDAVITTDKNGCIRFMNTVAEQLTGWTYKEADLKPLSEIFNIVNTYDRKHRKNPVEKALKQGKTVSLANHTLLLSKNGREYQIADSASPIIDGLGITSGVVLVFRDVTESYRMQNFLNNSLKEKEILLKEIHHRVKNNLQIIISLLRLQAGSIKSEVGKKKLLDSQKRIYALALVHEQLYQANNFATISFKNYVTDLLRNLLNTEKQRISWNCCIPEIHLDIKLLTPCGLILTELITNSLVHGFPKGKGEISVTVSHLADQKIQLVYKDNGIGLPKGIDPITSETLGLQLVRSLVDQLDGTIKHDNSYGLCYTIIFPIHE